MIAATLDTNVYIRAMHLRSPAASLLGHALSGRIRIDISDAILSEITRVLRDKFQWSGDRLHDARQRLLKLCNYVTPTIKVDMIKEDPDDNRILECASEAESEYIVTEDLDLLRLGGLARSEL